MKNRLLPTLALLLFLPSLSHAQIVDFGAQTKAINPAIAEHLEMQPEDGFEVSEVFLGSAAATLGLERGDILTHLNDRPLKSLTDIARILGATAQPGDKAKFNWLRKSRKMSGTVTLEQTASAEEFAQRYPSAGDSPAAANPAGGLADLLNGAAQTFMIGPDGKPMQLGQGQGLDFEKLGIDPADIQKQLQDALQQQGLGGLLGGLNLNLDQLAPGGSVSTSSVNSIVDIQISSMTPTADGSITHTSKGDDKHHFTIKDNDGQQLFQGSITADEIDQIPEAFREDAKRMMSGKVLGTGAAAGAGAAGPGVQTVPAEDIQELLKQLQEAQGK